MLGDGFAQAVPSSILSGNALIAREGVDLRKSMTYREGELLAVFLVLPHDDGSFTDTWDAATGAYLFQGHDSVTADAGKGQDQRVMYESGRLSDNGKFLKAANAFSGGTRREPLQIQVYEKLDPGVWFDKGIFDLIGADEEKDGGRRVFRFHLRPSNFARLESDPATPERMLSAGQKAACWAAVSGRCQECGVETGLRFVPEPDRSATRLLCPLHRGESGGLLG